MDLSPYLPSIVGGLLIGLGSGMLLVFNGRVAGISGIFGRLLAFKPDDNIWRFLFLGGLVLGGWLLSKIVPAAADFSINLSIPLLVLGGVVVGYGTRLGSGCTSGHGVCGISRLSPRSIVATLTFMTTGFLTVYLIRHIFGWGG